MLRYDPQRKCAKCGGEASRAFHAASPTAYSCWTDYCQYANSECREHLHRKCKTCGHDWCELPLDSEEVEYGK